MRYLDDLNPKQLEAVQHTEGPLLVLAGAGTGKTKVLTHRIAHIIELGLAQPHNILAVTFTNKASKEMQERISKLTSSTGLNLGTFHAIAARILRQHSHIFDLSSTFTIIDGDDQLKLVKSLLLERGVDKKYEPKAILGLISRWKDAGLLSSHISDRDIKSEAHRIAHDIYPHYQTRLVYSNAVDFGDLLLYNNELVLRHPDILEIFQQRYKYVLIDEYQDTNAVQYSWARALASSHQNLCCVGDDDQSIYSWRGAEVGNILRFEKDFPSSKVVKLEQNYRSSMPILTAAAGVIKNNKQRHGKSLWTEKIEGEPIKIVSCWNEKEEARHVTSDIAKFLFSGMGANNIAILVRAGFQTRPFEEALIANALPYKIIGGLKFYDRMEIKDTMAYIRATLNMDDDLALERIINVPKRAIGETTVKSIKAYAYENKLSMARAIQKMLEEGGVKNKTSITLSDLMNKFDQWRSRYKSEPAFNVTKAILEESGYMAALKEEKTDESRGRIENLHEMLGAIAEAENIQAFMEHVSLVSDHDISDDAKGAVSLMTLHAAKGLEFEAVFLPGWEEGIFPHQKAISDSGPNGLEEERRIAYVGITRAKKYLCISHAESRRMFHEYINSKPSRFIAEIPEQVSVRSTAGQNIYAQNSYSARIARPIHATPILPEDPMRAGTRVRHNTFGPGIVVRKNDANIEIAFDKVGMKTIKKEFVNLE
ncbi:MAG: UvrD-helicase domain-containing protein [Pseudomonadota bacterium]